jgi:hypothetical protein
MNNSMNENLVGLLRDVAKLTKANCSDCKSGKHCCSDIYGDIVDRQWPDNDFKTGDGPCHFLLSDGCSVPPEFRPLCSIHSCGGSQKDSPGFDDKYRELYNKIFDYFWG